MNNFLHNDTLNITEDISMTVMDTGSCINFIVAPGKDQVARILYRQKLDPINPF